jgi:hypothetical protein
LASIGAIAASTLPATSLTALSAPHIGVNQFEHRQRAFELAAHAVVERDFLALVILQAAVGELLQYRQGLGLGGQRELLDRGDLVVGFLRRQLAHQRRVRRGVRGASEQHQQEEEKSGIMVSRGKRCGRPSPAAQVVAALSTYAKLTCPRARPSSCRCRQ